MMNVNLLPLDREIDAKDYLNAAKAAAAYIDSCQKTTENGIYWVENEGSPVLDLYSGSAGIILFLLQFSVLAGKDVYIEKACKAGDYIIYKLQKDNFSYLNTAHPHEFTMEDNIYSLYTGGLSGIAFALIQLGRYSHNTRYETIALQITEQIAASAKPCGEELIWNGYSGIFHDSGVILYLLYAAKYFRRPYFSDIAVKAGKTIARCGHNISDTEALYLCVQDRFHYFERDSLAIMPGFSHGTAGITYTLAYLYKITSDRTFLEAARRGADYIIHKSHRIRKGKLIPYIIPDNDDHLYYLGYCNGVVGSSRLFLLLDDIVQSQKYHEEYLALLQGVIDTGAPEYHSAGYWNTQTLCCGTAGFVDMYLKAYRTNNQEYYLNLAKRSAKILLSCGCFDGSQAYWPSAFMRLDPIHLSADAGYMCGTAGIGESFLQIYAQLTGQNDALIYLPDDPDVDKLSLLRHLPDSYQNQE